MKDAIKAANRIIYKIIMDTNFLVDLFRFKLSFDDIKDAAGAPCTFLIVRQSVGELRRINTKHAKTALSIVDSGKIKIVKIVDAPGRTADDAIISLISFLKKSKEKGGIEKTAVATNDAKLRKRIKALDVKLIYLRARKYLEIE